MPEHFMCVCTNVCNSRHIIKVCEVNIRKINNFHTKGLNCMLKISFINCEVINLFGVYLNENNHKKKCIV